MRPLSLYDYLTAEVKERMKEEVEEEVKKEI